MDQQVRLPVRQLVEFVLRGGSIDNRFGGADRALEGSRIHRRLQKQEGEGYRAEVKFVYTCSCGGTEFTIEGRADGLFSDENGVPFVDEIKQPPPRWKSSRRITTVSIGPRRNAMHIFTRSRTGCRKSACGSPIFKLRQRKSSASAAGCL